MPSRIDGHSGTTADFSRTVSVLAAGLAATAAIWSVSILASSEAGAKTPGKTYCFVRKCHRVLTLEETRRSVGKRTVLTASHYDDPWRDRFNPRNLTSSGEWFRSSAPDNAASPKLPNGTILLAWNPTTRQAAVLRINNAGPYWGNRTLDVSRGAAQRLGFAGQGVATLHTVVLHAPTQAEATYRKGRRYAAVPGPIGAFASLEQAVQVAQRSIDGTPAPAPSSTVAIAAASPQAVDSITTATVPSAVAPTLAEAQLTSTPETAAATTPSAQPETLSGDTVASAASVAAAAVSPVVAAAISSPRSSRQAARRAQSVNRSQAPVVTADLVARAPRTIRRPITATGNLPSECQGWVGSCTVTVSSGASSGSRTRVASTSSKR